MWIRVLERYTLTFVNTDTGVELYLRKWSPDPQFAQVILFFPDERGPYILTDAMPLMQAEDNLRGIATRLNAHSQGQKVVMGQA
jgi:hypothetical protein